MRKVLVLVVLVFFGGVSSPAKADLMAIWDFGQSSAYYTENVTAENVVGVPTLVLSGGQKDTNGKDGVAYIDAAGVSHIAGQGAAWDDVKVTGPDADWILTIDTTGWKDISIRWDYKSRETPSFDLDYRVGRVGDWTDILNDQAITADDAWHSFSYDMSAISEIEGQAIVEFRMYDLDRAGNDRYIFDNLELTGVPEPCSIILLGLGGVALLRNRRA